MTTRSRRLAVLLASSALLMLTGSGESCSEGARSTTTPRVPEVVEARLERTDLRVVILTDLMGMLEPCGCTSRPLGGIDRMAARVAALRADGIPTVMLAAGDVFLGHPHAPDGMDGAEQQDVWRAELVADVLSGLDVAAAAFGPEDLRLGRATFEALRARARFPLLAADATLPNVVAASDTAASDAPAAAPAAHPPLMGHVVVERGGLRVGIVGVSALDGVLGASGPSDPIGVARREAAAARAEGASLVIALVSADRRTARRIAEGAEGVDLVVQGGLDDAEAHAPSTDAGAALLHAGRHGQGVLVVDLRRGEGRFTDVSSWTRTAERDRLLAQAAELRERLEAWSRDGTASAADLADQRARLDDLERSAERVAAAPAVTGAALSVRWLELADDAPRDPAVRASIEAYDQRVNEHNRDAFASRLPLPAPEESSHFTGSDACGSCHAAELSWWRTTLHGHAYQTLVDRHKEFNLDCVGCHVTGYEAPGGSTVSHVGALADVGCENCHGAGSRHAADPSIPLANVAMRTDTPEEVCARCHTPEHSDRFEYTAYRRMMLAPGHGMPDSDAARGRHRPGHGHALSRAAASLTLACGLLLLATPGCGGGRARTRDPAVAAQAPTASRERESSGSERAATRTGTDEGVALETREGRVSYYADSLRGRPTASGEPYDPGALTAASPDLPFGTRLRVTRLDTGASVEVRVNDRGPNGRSGRLLDLSRSAAEALDMIRAGVVTVRIEILERGAGRRRR